MEDEEFQLRFSFKFEGASEVFFAFAIPFSYDDTQVLACGQEVRIPAVGIGIPGCWRTNVDGLCKQRVVNWLY